MTSGPIQHSQIGEDAIRNMFAEEAKRAEQKVEWIQQKYRHDPLGFVMAEWPWGVPGTPLEHFTGPDENQRKFLIDLGRHVAKNNFDGHTPVPPVMMCISSAVGTGKSTLGAWVGWWILRTRPNSVGTVSAGTYQQLEERTWADMRYWGAMARGADLFDIQMSGIFHKQNRDKWKVTPKTALADRAQSFAGQHATTSTSWGMFDEAASVPEENWQAMYGNLSDGEPMFFAWGQMLQNSGEFYNVCFGSKAYRWDSRVFDGRTSAFTNKETIKEWAEEWGEDSDFYRVRVLGLPPRASSLQFIGQDLVDQARNRDHRVLDDEPLVCGYDAANGGLAKHVFAFRRGLDAKTIPPVVLPGDTKRDVVVAKACEIMAERHPRRKVAAMFGDQAFGAVVIQRVKDSGFTNCFEVNFGDPSLDKHYFNMRAYMWSQMKDWMHLGAIPDEERLCQQFMAPGFHHRNGKLVLESKEDMAKRGVRSPDYPDALCTTFARRVAPPPITTKPANPYQSRSAGSMGWAR